MEAAARASGTIYLVTNLVNGKRYVGQTVQSLGTRWSQHKWASATDSKLALHRAIRKYGAENFAISVLEEPLSDLSAAEIKHILEQQSFGPKGYNMTPGGERSVFTVPEIRQRHLEAVHRLFETDGWRENVKAAAVRRASDPTWLESHKAMVTGNDWKAAHQRGIDAAFADAAFREWNAERVRRQRAEGRFHELTPECRKVGLSRAHAERARQLAERDALLPADVLAKKLSARDRCRKYRAKKRACSQ